MEEELLHAVGYWLDRYSSRSTFFVCYGMTDCSESGRAGLLPHLGAEDRLYASMYSLSSLLVVSSGFGRELDA